MSAFARSLALAALAGLACTACGPAPRVPLRLDGVTRCRYDVDVRRARPLLLAVTARCEGRGVRGLAATSRESWTASTEVASDTSSLRRRGLRFELDRAYPSARFSYLVDLERLAERTHDLSRALRRGGILIAPASSFLLHPLPLDLGTDVEVHFGSVGASSVFSGLTQRDGYHTLEAHEIPVATYTVFGEFTLQSLALEGGRARLDVVVPREGLDLPARALLEWARARAEAVAGLFRGFPVPRATVAMVPVPGRDAVRFGNLLPESSPGIALLIGEHATQRDLDADWILIHELLHLGVPSFHREGKWFDEGLATYFEPIVRARAGLIGERELWGELSAGVRAGVRALTVDGLERADDTGTYWGGALFCLLADVELRKRSSGRRGLEDGLRKLRATGAHTSVVWSLRRALQTADAAFDSPVLTPLAERYARPSTVDVDALFASLGVDPRGTTVTLREDAPLAWVRRTIARGSAE